MVSLEFGKLFAIMYSLIVFRIERCWLIGEIFSFEENVDEVHKLLTPRFD